MSEAEVKELLHGFDTMDGYIRKTWKHVFAAVKVTRDGEMMSELEESVQNQMLDQYMQEVLEVRINNTDILMGNLRFVGKNGQPLHMMPMLQPDPELLEQPLYH